MANTSIAIGVAFRRSSNVISFRPLQKICRLLNNVDLPFGPTATRKLIFSTNDIDLGLHNIANLAHKIKSPFSCHPQFSPLFKLCRLSEHRQMVTSVHDHEKNCWRCGRQLDLEEELFFCECGVVQKVSDDLTYFELFGFDSKFNIDLEMLSKMYKILQTRLHPDKFTQKSEVIGLFLI